MKEDESYVGVLASQLWDYTYNLYPRVWHKFDNTNNQTTFPESVTGFPVKLVVVVKHVAADVLAKIIFLVNVPFSLDYKLQRTRLSIEDGETTVMLLNHRHLLLSTLVEFARTMRNCPPLDKDSKRVEFTNCEASKLGGGNTTRDEQDELSMAEDGPDSDPNLCPICLASVTEESYLDHCFRTPPFFLVLH
ncbi:hypothetical protein HAX54_032774, partial [Datura stramonium]|nr:hypothetical protein [Datura stramonium]